MSNDSPGDLYVINKTVKSTDICVGIVKGESLEIHISHFVHIRDLIAVIRDITNLISNFVK